VFAPQERGTQGGLRVAWAVVAKTSAGEVPVGKEGTLKTGDGVRIVLRHGTPSFAYVMWSDTEGALTLLSPSRLGGDRPGTGMHYLPSESEWYTLDGAKGTEQLYVIASAAKPVALERLLAENQASDKASQKKHRDAIIAEIARLSREQGSAAWSERPVTMGGQIRNPFGSGLNATELSGDAFVYGVVTIKHQ
jgi:hypothetical protein